MKSFSRFARTFTGTTIDHERSACKVHRACDALSTKPLGVASDSHTERPAREWRCQNAHKAEQMLYKQKSKFKTNKMFEANHVM